MVDLIKLFLVEALKCTHIGYWYNIYLSVLISWSFCYMLQTAMTIRNASKASNFGQPYQCSAAMPAPSNPPIVASPTVPALHLPYPLSSSTPLMPLLDTPESGSNHTNLVKPSTFFLHPSSSSHILPPVSTSSPTASLLNPPLSLQRPHGAPLLQPFPPPAPSPSLTPAPVPTHNYGLTISREKVRDALLALIQVSLPSISNVPSFTRFSCASNQLCMFFRTINSLTWSTEHF